MGGGWAFQRKVRVVTVNKDFRYIIDIQETVDFRYGYIQINDICNIFILPYQRIIVVNNELSISLSKWSQTMTKREVFAEFVETWHLRRKAPLLIVK